jgi:methyl-accepting chemotaxis protein
MMEIVCESCGKKYRFDETRIKGEKANLRCTACDHLMVFTRPRPGAGPSPKTVSSPPPRPATPDTSAQVSDKTESLKAVRASTLEAKKVRFGLAAKIIVVMLIVSLLPLGVFWGITFMESSDRIRKDAELLMAQTANGLMSQVDEWIDKNVRVLKTAAGLELIQSMDRFRQEPVLRAIQKEYPWMYLVFTVGLDGMNVARSDKVKLKDYSDRQYYKDIAGGKPLTWQTLIGKTSKKPSLVMAVPIKSGGKLVGVMAMAATIDDISKRIAAWKKGRTGFAFLVDEKGKVVSHQIKDYVLKQRNLSKHPLIAAFKKGRRPKTLSFENEKRRPSLGHVRGNRYEWALAIEQENREVFEALTRVQRFAFLLLAVTVLVVSLVAWLAAKGIIRPIRSLTDAAERMSLGDLNVNIDVSSKDEIGILARAIGRMQTSMRLAMERLRRTKSLK